MKKKDYKDLKLSDIEDAMSQLMMKGEPKVTRIPSIKHYVWEEDGQKYSSWKIDTGSSIINCGDTGMELFEKALKEQTWNNPEDNSKEK